jgi:hypothetical protein
MNTIDELKAAAQAHIERERLIPRAYSMHKMEVDPHDILALITRLEAAERVVDDVKSSEWRRSDRFRESLVAYDAVKAMK